MRLELGSTPTAWAADRCAGVVAKMLGFGVLVGLGGAVATAGPARLGAREIEIDGAAVAVPTGLALGTAAPTAPSAWQSATVVAPDVTADTWAVAAVAAGAEAPELLAGRWLPARLVAADGSVCLLGGWPD